VTQTVERIVERPAPQLGYMNWGSGVDFYDGDFGSRTQQVTFAQVPDNYESRTVVQNTSLWNYQQAGNNGKPGFGGDVTPNTPSNPFGGDAVKPTPEKLPDPKSDFGGDAVATLPAPVDGPTLGKPSGGLGVDLSNPVTIVRVDDGGMERLLPPSNGDSTLLAPQVRDNNSGYVTIASGTFGGDASGALSDPVSR
jgi:hypothetical protein